MTKKASRRFLFLILFLGSAVCYGQKVKYKDIFGLLNTKQYEQAEPFLKRYLINNDDNPNAYLFMGIIYQEKSLKMDVLKQTSEAISFADSAMLFFNKTKQHLDEKEIRRNKEYYQAYNRRDLRTGEFGVSLSDIQFDLEKRNQFLQERKDRLKMTKHYFVLSDSGYRKSQRLFNELGKDFKSVKKLYLRADNPTLQKLTQISGRFDSAQHAFENFRTSISSLGKTGYAPSLSLKPVLEFGAEHTAADLYKNEIEFFNYKQFADNSKSIIEKEIIPLRSHLVSYDVELNKLREKLQHDSVSVSHDLTKLVDALLFEKLQKFDEDPLPRDVFAMKTADLEYKSLSLENRKLKDSANINLQISILEKELKPLQKLDSISGELLSSNLEDRAADYAYFIHNTYGNPIVLHAYVKALNEVANRELVKKTQLLADYQKALKWIIDGNDSIPLDTTYTIRFIPMLTVTDKLTIGVSPTDSTHANVYWYEITPSRKAGKKVIFPIEAPLFKEKNVRSVKAMSYEESGGQINYVVLYNENPLSTGYSVSVAKIYKSDGLSWDHNYLIPFQPTEVQYKSETGDLILRNDTQVVLIDKNGKQK